MGWHRCAFADRIPDRSRVPRVRVFMGWHRMHALLAFLDSYIHTLSGPLAFSDSRILPVGLGPETPRDPSPEGRIPALRARGNLSFTLEWSPISPPGWQAGWGTRGTSASEPVGLGRLLVDTVGAPKIRRGLGVGRACRHLPGMGENNGGRVSVLVSQHCRMTLATVRSIIRLQEQSL